jgi:hypothetical protein
MNLIEIYSLDAFDQTIKCVHLFKQLVLITFLIHHTNP